MSNQIKLEKYFLKYNINYIYNNMSKTTVKTIVKKTSTTKAPARVANSSVKAEKSSKPVGKPTGPTGPKPKNK